jgi:TetR/AcrR family transcriptional repressor of bet genes
MPRPSNRDQRRAELAHAFSEVLADHGYANATMVAVAAKAGVSPGLLHYHFQDKRDMLNVLVDQLAEAFVNRARARGSGVQAWIDAALGMEQDDRVAARCWVGVLGEALRDPALFGRIQRLLGAEIRSVQYRSGHRLSQQDCVALLSMTVGYLVVGAFRPDLTDGHASQSASRFAQQAAGTDP